MDNNILLSIFNKLNFETCITIRLTCKKFKNIVDNIIFTDKYYPRWIITNLHNHQILISLYRCMNSIDGNYSDYNLLEASCADKKYKYVFLWLIDNMKLFSSFIFYTTDSKMLSVINMRLFEYNDFNIIKKYIGYNLPQLYISDLICRLYDNNYDFLENLILESKINFLESISMIINYDDDNNKMIRLLNFCITNKIDITRKIQLGNTLLHCAAKNINDNYKVLEFLLQYIDVNTLNIFSETPLHCVINDKSSNDISIRKCNLMLKFGVDIKIQNINAETAADKAYEYKKYKIGLMLSENKFNFIKKVTW